MNPTASSSVPAAASGLAGKLWRVLILCWIVLASAVLGLRYAGPALVSHYQDALASQLGEALGVELSVERVELGWQGWRPQLRLDEVRVSDPAGTEAFAFARIDAGLAASSWWRGELHFSHIEIVGARLNLVREQDGRIHVAGFAPAEDEADRAALDWLLSQGEVRLLDAGLIWEDRWRAAPRLQLSGLELRLAKVRERTELALQGRLPAGLGDHFELRAVLAGEPATALQSGQLPAGEFFLRLQNAVLANWEPWLALPAGLELAASAQLWAQVDEAGQLDARIELALNEAAGKPLLAPFAFELSLDPLRPAAGAQLAFAAFDLDALQGLGARLPLPEHWREALAALAPQGRIEQARLAWRASGNVDGNVDGGAPGWQLSARLREFSVGAWRQFPGVGGLSGELEGDEQQGRFQLDSHRFTLDLPQVFSAGPIVLDQLQAAGAWRARQVGWEIRLDAASLGNADLEAQATGVYRTAAVGAGEIELSAELSRASGAAVWRYLPRVAGELTQQWVREAVRSATVTAASLRLRGALDDFPYREGEGEFLVEVALEEGVLAYAAGWPQIDGIAAKLRFAGPGLQIEADKARIFGVALSKVQVDLPELDTHIADRMTITGEARGATADFLRFITASPVSASIDGMTDHMKASGNGSLKLRLEMPLLDLEHSQVTGEYRFQGNRLQVLDALPMLGNASGVVQFTERGIQIPQARAQFLGGETRLTARSGKEGSIDFELAGEAELAELEQLAAHGRQGSDSGQRLPWVDQLAGRLHWSAQLKLLGKRWQLGLESDLLGVASQLPAPLTKAVGQRWPLRLDLHGGLALDEMGRGLSGRLDGEADSGQRLGLNIVLDGGLELDARAQWSPLQALQAALALGKRAHSPALPERGLAFRLELDELDGEPWRRLLDGGAEEERGIGSSEDWLPVQGELAIVRLPGFGLDLEDVHARFSGNARSWEAELRSDRLAGTFRWIDSGSGALHARLDKLIIGEAGGDGGTAGTAGSRSASAAEDEEIEAPPRRLPALDVTAERFVLRGMELGRLQLAARNRSGLWLLDELSIANEDARLQGSGHWRTNGDPRTELDFTLSVHNIGRFSRRLGQEDVIRGGKAALSGELAWRGGPTHLHYASLGGSFSLSAEAGQFNKLEPGVGRLLGILSLQALPRRITLDFRDVFSTGFAFDGISGSMTVSKGVVHSDNFTIHGPAARINMRGWADLKAETQDLRVFVQPTLSESVALGAAATLVNPVAGVVTYLAQKVLSDPIEKLFAYEYEISGSWADPVVQRIGRAQLERP
ncbi:MAG: YhdP family protein [Thauera sp.]|jgi:uncharacterized protein (TIGR02099 family)|nr:YhdP family protein [Thauera sp.]